MGIVREEKHIIRDSQLGFMILGAFVVYNFMDAGKNMYRYASTGGWISMFFVFLLSAMLLKIIVYIMFTFCGETSLTIFPKVLGRRIAMYVFFMNGIIYMFLTCANIRLSGEIIKYTVLPNTPLVVTCALMAFLTLYGLLKRLPTIVRLSEIYGYLGLGIIMLIALVMSFRVDFYNLRPFFALSDVGCYINGIWRLYGNFIGLDVLFLLPLNSEANKHFNKNGTIALFILYVMFIFVGNVSIGIMGPEDIQNHINIFFIASRVVNVEYLDFLRRLDGFFYVGWFITIFLALIIYGYISTTYLREFCRLFSENHMKKIKRWNFYKKLKKTFKDSYINTAVFVSVWALIVAVLPKNVQEAMYFIKKMEFVFIFITTMVPIYIGYLVWFESHTKKNNINSGKERK